MHDLCNFKTQPIDIAMITNPQELPLEAMQSSTKHNSILCRLESIPENLCVDILNTIGLWYIAQ